MRALWKRGVIGLRFGLLELALIRPKRKARTKGSAPSSSRDFYVFLSFRHSHFIQQSYFFQQVQVFTADIFLYLLTTLRVIDDTMKLTGLERGFFGGSQPVWKVENIGLLWGKVPMFCLESTEVCLKEVRCFQFPKPIPSEKCFVFFSYISYTNSWNSLYSLGISDEGLGVEFRPGVG